MGGRENMFRALFTPYAEWNQRDLAWSPYRKKFKWDWHLRQLLYAVMPGAFVFLVCEAVERKYGLEKLPAQDFKKHNAKVLEAKDATTQTAFETVPRDKLAATGGQQVP